jgi:excisionase family DNA binding protein
MEEWITVKDAAQLRNCTERNVLRLIQKGELKAKREGHKWLILKETLEQTSEESPNVSDIISVLKVQLEGKDKQIEEKDKQIERLQGQIEETSRTLSESSQRHDTIVMQLTRQLEQSQKMLSAHQEPWYRRWFRKNQQPQNR